MKKVKNYIYQILILILIIGLVSACWPVNRRGGSYGGPRDGSGARLRDGSGNGPCTW